MWVQLAMNIPDYTIPLSPVVGPCATGAPPDSEEDDVSVSSFPTSLASEVDSEDLNSDSAESNTVSDPLPGPDIDLCVQLMVANKVRCINFFYCHFNKKSILAQQ